MTELAKLDKEKSVERIYKIMAVELKARLALAKGETLLGLGLMTDAADKQYELQKTDNDPPHYPQVLYNALGDAYLKAGSKDLAATAFEKALKLTRNDRFALIGLERAGKPTKIVTPVVERSYAGMNLDKYGPKAWFLMKARLHILILTE